MTLRSQIAKGDQDGAPAEQFETANCRCEDCHRPISHPLSLIAGRGPVCRQRAGVNA
ncbi:DUF6011 domain-containing protein [[Mycobacterium] nativiensis]|uniref:DUF6011 domain-containing protein n=1 Tax=[Mycobacterium] nativiensis TaxID=2855503 RepID=UPI001CD318FE